MCFFAAKSLISLHKQSYAVSNRYSLNHNKYIGCVCLNKASSRGCVSSNQSSLTAALALTNQRKLSM